MSEGTHMTRRIGLLSSAVVCLCLSMVFLGGCFGSGDTSETSAVTTPSSSATTSSSLLVDTTDGSSLVDGLPAEYAGSLGKRPVVVLFYMPGGVDDEKVLGIVKDLRSSFGNYTFLLYDYRVPSAYGDLAKQLGVDYQPQIVLMDRHGAVQTVWNGYVDKATLNQTLITLGRF